MDDLTSHSLTVGDSTNPNSHDRKDDDDDNDDSDDDDIVDRQSTGTQQGEEDRVDALARQVEKLQATIAGLSAENKRLSSVTFEFLRGSAMNGCNDMNVSGHSSAQSLPVQMAPNVSPKKPDPREESILKWGGYQSCLTLHYEHDFSCQNTLVFMHPKEVGARNYTEEELDRIKCRPFPSRLFITNLQLKVGNLCICPSVCGQYSTGCLGCSSRLTPLFRVSQLLFQGNTAWLRTRHTDHHKHKSSFIQVRDALKVLT